MTNIILRLSELSNFSICNFTHTSSHSIDFLISMQSDDVLIRDYCTPIAYNKINVGLLLYKGLEGLQIYADCVDSDIIELNELIRLRSSQFLDVNEKESLKTILEMMVL